MGLIILNLEKGKFLCIKCKRVKENGPDGLCTKCRNIKRRI